MVLRVPMGDFRGITMERYYGFIYLVSLIINDFRYIYNGNSKVITQYYFKLRFILDMYLK